MNPTIQLRSRQSVQLTYPPQRADDLWAARLRLRRVGNKRWSVIHTFEWTAIETSQSSSLTSAYPTRPSSTMISDCAGGGILNVEGRFYLMSWLKSGKFSIYAGPPMHAALGVVGDERAGSHSGRLNTICERYLAMVADELARLVSFTAAEWRAICDANNGVIPYADAVGTRPNRIWVSVHDTPGLGDKWDIDQVALAQKLRRLPRTTLIAIEEALDRFWSHTEMDTDEAFRVAGIMRTE